jgi:hypothetical protein
MAAMDIRISALSTGSVVVLVSSDFFGSPRFEPRSRLPYVIDVAPLPAARGPTVLGYFQGSLRSTFWSANY